MLLDLARDMMDRAEQKDQEKVDETELPEIPFNGEKDGDGEYELGEKQPAPKGQGEDGDSQGSQIEERMRQTLMMTMKTRD